MEVITKAEAARRWGLSGSMITKYVRMGLPTLPDGRLDWLEAGKWRDRFIETARSDNKTVRARAVQPAKARNVPPARARDDFDRGVTAARAGLREHMPMLITISSDAATFPARIRQFLEIDGYMARWEAFDGNVPEPGELPEIDWSDLSRDRRAIAVAVAAEVQKHFAGLPDPA